MALRTNVGFQAEMCAKGTTGTRALHRGVQVHRHSVVPGCIQGVHGGARMSEVRSFAHVHMSNIPFRAGRPPFLPGGCLPGQARPRSLKGCLPPAWPLPSMGGGSVAGPARRSGHRSGNKNLGCCLRGPLFGKRPSEARARHFRRAAGKSKFGGLAEDLDLNFGP